LACIWGETNFFQTLSTKNNTILKGFEVVNPEDVLIHMGDVAFSDEAKWNIKMGQCPHPWLVLGNHDSKSIEWYMNKGWRFVSHGILLRRYGLKILLTHKPQQDLGNFDINIHGHLHGENHHEGEFPLTKKHCLLALEDNGYKVESLEKFIREWQKK